VLNNLVRDTRDGQIEGMAVHDELYLFHGYQNSLIKEEDQEGINH
jgi:hypothetical protein